MGLSSLVEGSFPWLSCDPGHCGYQWSLLASVTVTTLESHFQYFSQWVCVTGSGQKPLLLTLG